MLLVITMAFLYFFVFSYITVIRLLSFNAHYYDLGIMDQTVYNTSRGRLLEMTHPDLAHNIVRFAIHFDPIMAILSPLYMINASPIVLLISQTFILALGGIAIFLIARRVLKSEWLGVLFAFLYLNYYPLQLTNMFDFHAVIFATTAFLFAFYFLAFEPFKRKLINPIAGFVCLTIALLSKENAALTVIFLSVFFAFTKKYKIKHIVVAIASFIIFLFLVFKLIPLFNGAESFAIKYYDFAHPINLIRRLFSADSLKYVMTLLFPFGFTSLFAPTQLLIALPEFLLNLLSSNPNMRQVYFHFTAVLTPFIAISAIYGFNTIKRFFRKKPKIIFTLIILLVICNIWNNLQFGMGNYKLAKINWNTLQEVQYWRKQLKNDQIKISTTSTISPFFTEREYFYNFLYDPAYDQMGETTDDVSKNIGNYEKADYVIILAKDIPQNNSLIQKFYNALKQDQNFSLISNQNGVEVYKKTTS